MSCSEIASLDVRREDAQWTASLAMTARELLPGLIPPWRDE
jgi:hypothetical protein